LQLKCQTTMEILLQEGKKERETKARWCRS
jgi:hypothetical protein